MYNTQSALTALSVRTTCPIQMLNLKKKKNTRDLAGI